jgi:hypothetical protein
MNSKNIRILIINILMLCLFSVVNGQDTVWVNTINYNSNTRDTLISFPTGDHNQYEKILMYYSMRCKDGLLSTTNDRNKGCGEWDYLCNTFIVDSSYTDSLKATHPNYIIDGFTENFFLYTSKPTFNYYEYILDNLSIISQSNVNYTSLGTQSGDKDIDLTPTPSYKSYYLYTPAELSGITSIKGLQLNSKNTGTLKFFRIRLGMTSESKLTTNVIKNTNFEMVLNRDVVFSQEGKSELIFHQPYSAAGNKNLVIEISFASPESAIGALALKATSVSNESVLGIKASDSYIDFKDQGTAELSVNGMADIKNEISVSFWAKGNASVLPNNNSAFYAVDASGNRQLNVHLPWSNSRIYWDCGGDASGYDRIDKASNPAEFEEKWNHWVFTKNTVSGNMKIYLNGAIWHSGTGKKRPISISKFVLGADIGNTIPYSGFIDNFAVWNKELNVAEILSIMYNEAPSVNAVYDNLVAYYDLNEAEGKIINDRSKFKLTGQFLKEPSWNTFRGYNIFKEFLNTGFRPDISLITGNFNITTTQTSVRDSIMNDPYKIRSFSVQNGSLAEGTPLYYWAAGFFPVFDENGIIIDEVEFPEEGELTFETLLYYQKSPAKYELLSFVTPYGIGLDFGLGGKTWIFDVTDYGPVLKNSKRLLISNGGEWQEELDIKFAFIKGKPARNVLKVQQVWPAKDYFYTSILNNDHLENRTLFVEPEVKSMKARVVTTGHGQEGEFIARVHSLNINGGNPEFVWEVWKECADNPIYPQGGTWVYDRAGWCPGAPSDLKEFEIMPFVNQDNSFSLNYGLNSAEGSSTYLVNTQIVKYGEANFDTDAALDDIISPSENTIYKRINPVCSNPIIKIRNNGKSPIKDLIIRYGIEGKTIQTYNWTGNLEFLKSEIINLPNLPFSDWNESGKFTVNIDKVNDKTDNYAQNNNLSSEYVKVPDLKGNVSISLKTNAAKEETSWVLKNDSGEIISKSRDNMSAFTEYRDTLKNLHGCYKLQFIDSDEDGISWWANNDGAGVIRIKGENSDWITFQPDFGRELTFNFTAGMSTSVDDKLDEYYLSLSPNPITNEFQLELRGISGLTHISIYNNLGITISNETINNHDIDHYVYTGDMSNYKSGIYYIQVNNKNINRLLKVIKL